MAQGLTILEIETRHSPESLARTLVGDEREAVHGASSRPWNPANEPGAPLPGLAFAPHGPGSGLVLLRSHGGGPQARYSFVAARPFLTFRSFGSRCETLAAGAARVQYGDPWRLLDALLARCEILDAPDLPFPCGGCFGFWGYDLKNFLEPKLSRRAWQDTRLPDCHVGFYSSLVVFDHAAQKQWIVSTGLAADGSRDERRRRQELEFWQERLSTEPYEPSTAPHPPLQEERDLPCPASNLSREDFIERVRRAQDYIRRGHIYQVNLSQRFTAPLPASAWDFGEALASVSPAPFSAFLDGGDFQLVSSSPELFLRLNGAQVRTRPIKGTRPRSLDPAEDARLAFELQTSPKDLAELIMITDLLRNDLGKVCEYGSVRAPDLARMEDYPQVRHLVSTVEGRLRPEVSHLAALGSCFPGGSITGAPKFRAMEIIDELEPEARGPYTGALGYLGFNRESQLSIIIRTAVCADGFAAFPVGAGIVADSSPAAEYDETLAKALGFFQALRRLPAGPSPATEPTAGHPLVSPNALKP